VPPVEAQVVLPVEPQDARLLSEWSESGREHPSAAIKQPVLPLPDPKRRTLHLLQAAVKQRNRSAEPTEGEGARIAKRSVLTMQTPTDRARGQPSWCDASLRPRTSGPPRPSGLWDRSDSRARRARKPQRREEVTFAFLDVAVRALEQFHS